MNNYVYPEVLVSTEWVANNIDNPEVRIVESDEDILLYNTGHIPNAVKIDWQSELQDQTRRDYISKERFEILMSEKGITNKTKVVFYGDKSNWWACYALWVFKLFGHEDCLIMNGGRQKWSAENRQLTKGIPQYTPTVYNVQKIYEKEIRAFRNHILPHIETEKPLIDVRSPDEYSGKLLHREA